MEQQGGSKSGMEYVNAVYCHPAHLTYMQCECESESESEVTQSCPTLCDPVDYSPPGSSVHGIFQARVLQWVAISFSGPYFVRTLHHEPSWVALHGTAHSFIELDNAVIHLISLVSFL